MPRDAATGLYRPPNYDDRTEAEQADHDLTRIKLEMALTMEAYFRTPTLTTQCAVNNLLSDYQTAWIKARKDGI